MAYYHNVVGCVFFTPGNGGYTELWRDGVKVSDLMRTDDYDYDRPEIVR